MVRLSPVSWDALVRRLRELGFEGPYAGGKHLFMIRGELRLTIPNPHRREISRALVARILRRAGIERDSWLDD